MAVVGEVWRVDLLLDQEHVEAVLDQVGDVRVAKTVRAEGRIEPGLLGCSGERRVEPFLTDSVGRGRRATDRWPRRVGTAGQMSVVHWAMTSAAPPITVSTPRRPRPQLPDALAKRT